MEKLFVGKTREVSETWGFLCAKFKYTNLTDKELASHLINTGIVTVDELLAVIRQVFEEQKG